MPGTATRAARFARELQAAELVTGVPATLIGAVMDRESLCGGYLDPELLGDHGNGHGLMQIDGRYHATFIAAVGPDGVPLWKVPRWNILYGAELLRANLQTFAGDVEPAVCSYNADLKKVRKTLERAGRLEAAARRQLLDSLTTGRNYVTDVLRRRLELELAAQH